MKKDGRGWPRRHAASWVAVLVVTALIALLPSRARPAALPRVAMVRTHSAPHIDGILDDAVWQKAAVIDEFRQVEPLEGGQPTERTEVRLLYDADHVYLGFRVFDREPEKLIVTQMNRDGSVLADDRVSWVLDTFHDRRNAFFFQVNAAGTRVDGIIEDNRTLRVQWDGIWHARTSIDDQGWVAEVSIPLKTLSFDPEGSVWGMNILRSVRRRNELLRWTNVHQNKSFINVADIGLLTGLHGLRQGIGLDIVPFTSATVKRSHDEERGNTLLDPGFDAFYRITPSMTAALTVNTDFAEAGVDTRRVNLTRFSLFFPETRDFFLQDAGIFDFGGLAETNGIPFFSRRIGIGPTGEVVPLRVGFKVTGREKRLNLGLLDVQTAARGGIENKNLAVARAFLNVLEESSVGMIFTRGDPTRNVGNALGGLDFRYRNSRVFGSQQLTGDLWLQRSSTPGEGDGQWAWGAALAYPNDRVDWYLGVKEIQENFNPALGFVNRRGIRDWTGKYRFRLRQSGGAFRTLDSQISGRVVTDLGNDLESLELAWKAIEIANHAGDRLEASISHFQENLDGPFEIAPGVVIPSRTHTWQRFGLGFDTSEARALRARLDVAWGTFFTGHKTDVVALLEWRPSRHLFLSLEYEQNAIRLPQGNFTPRIMRLRINVAFTPDLSWNTFAQHDNVSDVLAINSQLRWIIEPGREFFIVVNQGFRANHREIEGTFTALTTKLGWTFRF